ncbi:unnamed protein product [Ilex paraguariensis]|uniref:Katanin p60 ATPase-containing subunit A-like 2 n=2 Tax=Ilex paraguariensis TaxID=185542 RepID=A0ABC8RLL7_9AQUA
MGEGVEPRLYGEDLKSSTKKLLGLQRRIKDRWRGEGEEKMDGLTRTDELVFVLAATNLPWELDAAMLRRLEKRILVPLPEPEARRAMFEELLPSVPGEDKLPYDLLMERTNGYSGSDIRLVCKEAAMQPLRRLMGLLEEKQELVPEDDVIFVVSIIVKDIQRP